MSVPVWARDRPREKPPVTVFSAPSETPPRGRETRGVRERGPSSKRSDDSSPRGDRAKLGKTTGVMAVGAWSAREIARMIESGVPSSDILQAIRSGRESADPLEFQGLGVPVTTQRASSAEARGPAMGEPGRASSAKPQATSEGSSSHASTPQWSSDRSSRDGPRWTHGSSGATLGFAKRALPPLRAPGLLEVKGEEEDMVDPPGPIEVEPEVDPQQVTAGLAKVGLFGNFTKKAVKPQEEDLRTSKGPAKVPKALPRRTRPLEQVKLEEYRKLCRHLFEELVIHRVEMDLVDSVAKDGEILDDSFYAYTDPKSAGTALRYARLMSKYLQDYDIKHGAQSAVGPKPFSLEAIQAFVTAQMAEQVGYYTPQSFLYAVEYFSSLFGFHSPGSSHPRVRKLCRDYIAKAPERSPAPHFEVAFLHWLELAVLDDNLDLQSRVACGKLRLCSEASIRHSDLAGTAMRDVEWCRIIGGSEVLGLRAKSSYTKSGPRTWAASLLGVHPDNDAWLTKLVELLLTMHGSEWKTHSFVGCAAGDGGRWKMHPPLIDEDTLTVKRALLSDIDSGKSKPMSREAALRLRWHGCKATMPLHDPLQCGDEDSEVPGLLERSR